MDKSPEFPEDPQLHQVLRRLPYPQAPTHLAASVIARLHTEKELVWWRRPILAWPLAARTLGVGWLMVLALSVAYALGGLHPDASLGESATGNAGSPFGLITLAIQIIATLGSAVQACIAAVPLKAWWFLGGTVGVAYLGCLAVGTFVYRRMVAPQS